jgi:DUF1680 family protein
MCVLKKTTRIFLISVSLIISISCNKEAEVIFDHDIEYPKLDQVRLLEGPFKTAMDNTSDYLHSLNSDKLLHYFRLNAGFDTITGSYGGWETRELRGHSLGHFLSACSMMYAANGDTLLKDKTDYIVQVLAECQEQSGSGYLSAFPEEFIDRVENTEEVWAPYYTLHKIMAGLYDCYKYTGNKQALEVLKNKADWLNTRCDKIPYKQMQNILDHTEQGGMNELLFNLYSVTGENRYYELGNKFYQASYFRPILSYYDSLKGQHVNSFIPNVIGLMREYELTGNKESYRISKWFWKQVVESRSFVTGGTSNDEHWGSDPFHIHTELGPSSHETCCTYNMLKLTKHLFAEEQDPKYMDYYERALINGILPTQDPSSKMTMYYVPMQSGFYKTFGTPENSFWCCTGTGMENFSRSGEAIYMAGYNKLFVNLYIASELSIDNYGIKITQHTEFPANGEITLDIESESKKNFILCLRIPEWTGDSYYLSVNGKQISAKVRPGNYIEIDRIWKDGDIIKLNLTMNLNLVSLPSSHELSALIYGPMVMAGVLSDTGLTDDKVYGRYGPYMDTPQEYIPHIMLNNSGNPSESFTKSEGAAVIALTEKNEPIEFVPFYKLFGSRYMIYFKTE